ncbi:hypothetical protein BC827DRAFT_1225132 [Russula dissimulans]|nr:hypothetical protein BC827DRAFT_1225132 [Russula dissimulans]
MRSCQAQTKSIGLFPEVRPEIFIRGVMSPRGTTLHKARRSASGQVPDLLDLCNTGNYKRSCTPAKTSRNVTVIIVAITRAGDVLIGGHWQCFATSRIAPHCRRLNREDARLTGTSSRA